MAYQPKSYKKFVATAATATLVASAIAPAASAAFSDVADRYKEAVDYLATEGISQGYPNGKFGTDDNIKRQDAAVMIAKALGGSPTGTYANAGFTDVPADRQWAVNFLVEKDIVSGKAAGQFGANDFTTRGEMAKIIANAYKFVGDASNAFPFTDVSETFKQYVDALNEAGVAQGYAGTTQFGTGDLVTRGQFALFVYRAETHTPATPEVVSVSAINANEILVTFNKALNKVSAETEANYSLDAVALKGADEVTLNADKKSVTIKLATDGTGVLADGLLDNNTAYEVAVVKGLLAADNTEMASKQSKTILFADKAAPVVNSITSLESGNVVISFNERLNEATKPFIVLNEVTVSPSNVTVNADGTVTILAADPAVSALQSGKSYTAVVSDAKDLIGNTMGLVTKTFTYSINNTQPELLTATADGETSIELKFDEVLSTSLVNNSTVKVLKGSTPITATVNSTDNTTFNLDLSYADVFAAGETSANLTVVVEGYKDLQGNLGQKVTKSVILTKDVVKPTVTKTAYDSKTSLVTLTFSEGLNAESAANYASKMFVTDANGVKYNVVVTDTAATELVTTGDVADGAKTISFDASEFANGTYALTIQAGALTDEANTVNGIATTSVSFTKGSSADGDTPTFDSAVQVVKGQFTATFSEPVKGGAVTGSATALTNYKLNGAALPAGTTIYLNEAKTIATITLPEGTIASSGVKLLTASNVQDLSGKAIDETTLTINLTENTNPVLSSAKVVNNSELELTFSESVTSSFDFADFEVTVNGVAVTEAAGVTTASGSNKLVLSVTDANLATGNIVVKVADTTNAVDAAGNTLVTGTSVTATR